MLLLEMIIQISGGGVQLLQQPLDLVQEQQQGWGWEDNKNAVEAAGWLDDFEAESPQTSLMNITAFEEADPPSDRLV